MSLLFEHGPLFAGRVAEISLATASEFSIIKADSGTGDFVKIAQRMAVEVRVDTKQKGHDR